MTALSLAAPAMGSVGIVTDIPDPRLVCLAASTANTATAINSRNTARCLMYLFTLDLRPQSVTFVERDVVYAGVFPQRYEVLVLPFLLNGPVYDHQCFLDIFIPAHRSRHWNSYRPPLFREFRLSRQSHPVFGVNPSSLAFAPQTRTLLILQPANLLVQVIQSSPISLVSCWHGAASVALN